MKKSLVLAMAMALGVTASAYAANPFSDVPAGHWAYDSINKLAAAGIVNGYEDGTFKGQKLMTRYEMAKIVATAMAKGANVDRLASEFADELDSLGVRVANLEKKSDNVKITGQLRWQYYDKKGDTGEEYSHKLRSRIWVNGQINDDWKYAGMLQNMQNFKNEIGDENTTFKRVWLDGRIGGAMVRAGRYGEFLSDGNIYDTTMEAIKLSYGSKVKLEGYYGNSTEFSDTTIFSDDKTDPKPLTRTLTYDKAWGVHASTEAGKLNLFAGYDKFQDGSLAVTDKDGNEAADTITNHNINDDGIFTASAVYKFGKPSLGLMYLKSDLDLDNGADTKGWVASLNYGGANMKEVGTWGLMAKYYNQGAGTFIAHTMCADANDFFNQGFKGYMVGGEYVLAKNMKYYVEYNDLKGKLDNNKQRVLWGHLLVNF